MAKGLLGMIKNTVVFPKIPLLNIFRNWLSFCRNKTFYIVKVYVHINGLFLYFCRRTYRVRILKYQLKIQNHLLL